MRSRAWTIVSSSEFTTTLTDGRRVVGRYRADCWFVRVYSAGQPAQVFGFGAGATRPVALARAGLSGVDAGEVLGRIGI
jgi:hypothetical protein